MMLLQIVLLMCFFSMSLATLGVDVSQATSTSSFSCLKSSGYTFAIPRVYQSNGKVDPNGAQTIKNAWAGGMAHVDGYIFPCYSCGNPAGQMDSTISNLKSSNATFGMIWIDVEGTSYWSTDQAANTNFIVAMANEGVAKGVSIGIYTSNSQWSPITGGSTKLSKYPLWYPHYENTPNPSYSDFVAFGGWSKPAIKQYKGTSSICSASVDYNYY